MDVPSCRRVGASCPHVVVFGWWPYAVVYVVPSFVAVFETTVPGEVLFVCVGSAAQSHVSFARFSVCIAIAFLPRMCYGPSLVAVGTVRKLVVAPSPFTAYPVSTIVMGYSVAYPCVGDNLV